MSDRPIPVAERLPEFVEVHHYDFGEWNYSENVLVFDAEFGWVVAQWTLQRLLPNGVEHCRWSLNIDGVKGYEIDVAALNVTHWLPLPPRPTTE